MDGGGAGFVNTAYPWDQGGVTMPGGREGNLDPTCHVSVEQFKFHSTLPMSLDLPLPNTLTIALVGTK